MKTIDSIFNEIIIDFNKSLKLLIIEGLKLKGFYFENAKDLDDFIKSNCRCEDKTDIKQRTYFVNDIPFFIHFYEIEMPKKNVLYEDFKFTVNNGSYMYL